MLSGRLLVPARRRLAWDRPSRRCGSAVPARCVEMTPPAARHATRPAPRPLRHDCHPSGHAPPLTATVSPSHGTGEHSLFNALPTSRPARTGPPTDSEGPIVLGVNLGKGVYVVRQLTPCVLPPLPLSSNNAWLNRVSSTHVSPAQDQATCAGSPDCYAPASHARRGPSRRDGNNIESSLWDRGWRT